MKLEEHILSGLDKLKACYKHSMAIEPDFAADSQNWEPRMQDRNRWMEQAEEIDRDLRPAITEWRNTQGKRDPEVNRLVKQSTDDLVSLIMQVQLANDRMYDAMHQQKEHIGNKLLNLKGKRKAIACYAHNPG